MAHREKGTIREGAHRFASHMDEDTFAEEVRRWMRLNEERLEQLRELSDTLRRVK